MPKMLCAATLAFAAFLSCIAGCWEAEPDGDTMGELRDTVASFPIELKTSMARWAANRVAFGYVAAHGEGYIGDIDCYNPSSKVRRFAQITLQDMLKCLSAMQTTTYRGCLDIILENTYQEHVDDGYVECKWNRFTKDLAPEEMPPEAEADRVMQGDMTWVLIGLPPPPLEIQMMLLGVHGVLGPKGALCPQGVDWACAPSPFGDAPGGSSGGDR